MITHTPTLSRDWSIRNAIQRRVDTEDMKRWAQREEVRELPKYEPVKVEKHKTVWGFLSEIYSQVAL